MTKALDLALNLPTQAPPESDELTDWLAWLEQLDPSRMEFGLERIRLVYQRLPQLSSTTKVVTIAGTNGKGSCVAALQASALALGKSVVSFSSPHLLRYNERVQIQGQSIADQQLVSAFSAIAQVQEDIFLSYFEYSALAALLIAAKEKPDILILEVGLGGRLDAVNLIDADLVILTAIGMDHMNWLGHDLESIAAEKCGVIRPEIPLVLAAPNMPEVVYRIAGEMAVQLFAWGKNFEICNGAQGWQLRVGEEGCSLGSINLHPQSCAAAAMASEILWQGESNANLPIIAAALQAAQLSGRFQRCQIGSRQVILDVAHNPMSLESLCGQLEQACIERVDLLFSIMADKDAQGAIDILSPYVEQWRLLRLKVDRALQPEDVAEMLAQSGIENIEIVDANSKAELQQIFIGKNQQIPLLVTGSFYTVSAVLEHARMAS